MSAFWKQKTDSASSEPYLDNYVSFGAGHSECRVRFFPAEGKIGRDIIDGRGNIVHFPGFDESDPHMKALGEKKPLPRVCFRTDFVRKPDGRHLMIWQVQPDGRYWADEDGFGMTSDVEIDLYTFIDEKGRFTAPFRVYRVGSRKYYSDDI